MSLNLTDKTKEFLGKNLPDYKELDKVSLLDALYDLIDEKGFAPPKFHEYNVFGREAQEAYDDIYWNNL